MQRNLVIAPNWIGDALMAQPLLGRLGGRIDVLAPAWVAPVVRRMPEVSEVIEAPFRHGPLQLGSRWRLGRSLKRRGYDAAYVLPNSWKSALVPFFAGIPKRIGYVGEARFGLLNVTFKNAKAAMPQHYAALAGEGTAGLPRPRLEVGQDEIVEVCERFGIEEPYVALCPGAEYGPAKRWPYFRELAAKLPSVVVLGSASDREAASGMAGRNLVGKTSLDDAVRLIAGATAVVSNDSGLMHVAAALVRPLVAVFGSSSPEHTPPASDKARVLWLRLECSPCFQRECPLGHFRCMKEITVDQVLDALKA
ncbi:MAG TPA: lipopolysaccharide heptosyltransferase II [Burkholderiales bacterium]|nr:lipopolysaccharide heptosyltransferase II [Burkholderiales bacterium]